MAACTHPTQHKIFSTGRENLLRCQQCGLVVSDKYEDGFSPVKLYNKYYKPGSSERFTVGVEQVVRSFRFLRALGIKIMFPKAKSILDVGSGRGFMLYYLKKYFGFKQAVGTQIARNALEFSRDRLKLDIRDKDLLKIDWKDERFDVVSMWHVLEHIEQPELNIMNLSHLITQGGGIIIEVPNFNSWTRRLSGKYWLGLDLEYHLSFFDPNSLSALLDKYGLRVKKIRTFSWEYSAFISTQSIVGRITKADQSVFKWLQSPCLDLKIFSHILLFMLLFLPCFLVNLLLYFSERGEVLFVVAQKEE